MSPKLNISHMGLYFCFISLILITSGATYPGVPHLTNKNSSEFENYARPKSAITHYKLFLDLNKIFYGFKSRCIIPLECIYFRPSSKSLSILFVSLGLN